MGITPQDVSDVWVPELELREAESLKPPPVRNEKYGSNESRDKQENARDLVLDALTGNLSAVPPETAMAGTTTWRGVYQARLIQLGVIAIALAIAAFLALQPKGDMNRWSRDQLEGVSHHLASGGRDSAGKGQAFVGTINDDWLDLSFAKRTEAAVSLVVQLRELGVRQIMIYDRDDQLQIQAIGSQPIRTRSRETPR
jgi:hypothetical protein